MEEKQRVYIKGNPKRGYEVIKILTDLGGLNYHNCNGRAEKNYYYINPLGIINCIMECQSSELLLVKEFYKEIKLPRWKPIYEGSYFFINSTGFVTKDIWNDSIDDIRRYRFCNCFRTQEEAIALRDKIKQMLKDGCSDDTMLEK